MYLFKWALPKEKLDPWCQMGTLVQPPSILSKFIKTPILSVPVPMVILTMILTISNIMYFYGVNVCRNVENYLTLFHSYIYSSLILRLFLLVSLLLPQIPLEFGHSEIKIQHILHLITSILFTKVAISVVKPCTLVNLIFDALVVPIVQMIYLWHCTSLLKYFHQPLWKYISTRSKSIGFAHKF